MSFKNRSKKTSKQVGGNLPMIEESDLDNKKEIKKSGDGIIYSITYKNQPYAYKELVPSSEWEDDISQEEQAAYQKKIEFLQENAKRFLKLGNNKYLAPPIHFVIEDEVSWDEEEKEEIKILGYTMKLLSDYTTVNDMINKDTSDTFNIHKVIADIVKAMRDLTIEGLPPCPEHGNNIMVPHQQELPVVTVDLDEIYNCNGYSERDALEQLGIILTGSNRLDRYKTQLRDYFFIENINGVEKLKLYPKFQTYDDLLAVAQIHPVATVTVRNLDKQISSTKRRKTSQGIPVQGQGGKRKQKSIKIIRKHRGIIQRGGKKGKLKKGFKYTGRRLKSGKAEIVKVTKNKKNKKS